MYREHFGLTTWPFSLTPNTEFYCDLENHHDIMEVLQLGLKNNEGFIKITGEIGAGKTLLCHKLLRALAEEFHLIYLANPDITPQGLRLFLARALHVSEEQIDKSVDVTQLITEKLLSYAVREKNVVLVIDEAQALSDECMEAIRLLTNLETENAKLLQVVLVGQPELNERIAAPHLKQLQQRITFNAHLHPLNTHEIAIYLQYRLMKAGYQRGNLFTPKAIQYLFRASGGVPRVINVLCHKAMMIAYGRGQIMVDHRAVKFAIEDTDNVKKNRIPLAMLLTACSVAFLVGMSGWFIHKEHLSQHASNAEHRA